MAIPIDNTKLGDKYKKYLSELNVTTSGFRPFPCSSDYYTNIVYTTNEAAKNKKEEKEKKEMANAKMCDICGVVYSTKKYTKISDDVEDKYDIHLKIYDSCADGIEICPDCYKALIDKLVERGLEPVEEDDEKKDDD